MVYLFTAGRRTAASSCTCRSDRDKPTVPSLAALSFPAGRFEREMHDLYGIVPVDHPLPRRLVRHPHWPAGWYPMRHDAGRPPPFGARDEPFPFLTVEGPGVYEIPVGPVHAGLIEPGHFRFSVVGETILKLKARLWYVHKGIEKLFEGRAAGDRRARWPNGSAGTPRSGTRLAYCRAVEDALDLHVPAPRPSAARAILLELERLYNHVADIGALCNDVGHGILNAHALRVRETPAAAQRARPPGTGCCAAGCSSAAPRCAQVPDPARLAAIAADIREIVDLALGNSLVAERFTGTAVLDRAAGRATSAPSGYVARASGLRRRRPPRPSGRRRTDTDCGPATRYAYRSTDRRRAGPVPAARGRDRRVPRAAGRAGPHRRSRDAVNGGPTAGQPRRAAGVRGRHRRGLARHDRAPGRARPGPTGSTRVKIVDPSFFNWPALPVALADTIVADFPLVNKSFNLSYAGNDL